MKSNFEFLKEYWPALAQIGETAENYLYSDPNACIYKIGLFTERLVQEILVFEGIVEPDFPKVPEDQVLGEYANSDMGHHSSSPCHYPQYRAHQI